MRSVLLAVSAVAVLQAGVTDFHTLQKAKEAYESGNYTEASAHYAEVKDKNEQARFNYADALYKAKQYGDAAKVFSTITDPALKQQALHNLGNSLALSGKTDEAIQAYEASLKLGDDEDTRYNLELLKKQQQQQDQKQQNDKNDQRDKQDQKDQQDQKSDQQQKEQQNRDQQNKNGQQNQQDQKAQNDQQKQDQHGKQNENKNDDGQDAKEKHSKSEQQKKQHSAEAKQDEKRDEAQQAEAQAAMAEPISDMEERKYNKMLDKRGIKTLMIPLSGKGAPRDDETTPW